MISIIIKRLERKGIKEMKSQIKALEERCYLLEKGLVNAVAKMLPDDSKGLDKILGALLIHPPDKE